MSRSVLSSLAMVAAAVSLTVSLTKCSGETVETPAPAPEAVVPEPVAELAPLAEGPHPAILMVQAQFIKGPDNHPKPGPARLTIYRTDGAQWVPEVLEDPDSNVFHKAVAWRDGVLTIGAMKAALKHWKKDAEGWKATTLWEKSWGGKFDRIRDIEIADIDGDEKEEIILATHDMGVVAVGDENEDGTWTFQEFDRKPDTFVHEIEVGDVDGDGKIEFYATPSERNRASGTSQPGGVARYDFDGGKYKRTMVVSWKESHAKEILVTDLDGDGVDELYAAKEGHVEKGEKGGKAKLVEPAKIVRFVRAADGTWTEQAAYTLEGEKQCRFMVPGDVNHDGKRDLVVSGMETGLWLLESGAGGALTGKAIDEVSGGFEHATHVADLDGDGKLEVYAASEKSGAREFRRYIWDGTTWQKTRIDDIPMQRITWSLQDAKL